MCFCAQNLMQIRRLVKHLNTLDGLTTTEHTRLRRLTCFWEEPDQWVNECQIIDDQTSSMDLSLVAMIANDLKFSPLSQVIRCTDHLKQNIIRLLNSKLKQCIPKWFDRKSEVC